VPPISAVASLSDDALLAHVETLVSRERLATAELIASLGELDMRRLYLGVGCSSLFTYCTQVLHLSEHAAYGRIEAARCARRFPQILERLADGSVTLTAICLIAPVMTERNVGLLLSAARHKSKREVEYLVAEVRPQPVAATIVRKLPPAVRTVSDGNEAAPPILQPAESNDVTIPQAPRRPPAIQPLTSETYKVQFTLSQEGYEDLCRAQDLLRHSIPNGDAAVIFERALSLLVEDLERKKHAATERPRGARPATAHSRHIPSAVRRAVWRRDEGRCAFVGSRGRCAARGFLEYHHVIPFAEGGETSAANIQLRCRAHNQHEARLWFGRDGAGERTSRTKSHKLGPDRVDVGRAPPLELEPP
jgi:5-methylcytosine-specific restriction endonuclease McrA